MRSDKGSFNNQNKRGTETETIKYLLNEHPYPPSMYSTCRKASLNINGIAARLRFRMLEDFHHRNDIDLMCIQEIIKLNIKEIKHYEAHVNIGEKGRWTALLVKEAYILSDVRRMPSGRGITSNISWGADS
jgi:hypothetical protein